MCEFVKLFVDCKTRAQIESWKHKHVDGFYTKTTQKGGFRKLCVEITHKKKHVYDKHNVISFYGRIVF